MPESCEISIRVSSLVDVNDIEDGARADGGGDTSRCDDYGINSRLAERVAISEDIVRTEGRTSERTMPTYAKVLNSQKLTVTAIFNGYNIQQVWHW